jgi:DNA-directed RNA polymerase specialized sigma24 family protein
MFEIEDLKKSPEVREKFFTELYKNTFPAIAKFVSKRGGSFHEAKDIFQDALIVYYEKTVSGAISISGSEKAYVFGIAKHLWHNKFKNENGISARDHEIQGHLADEAEEQFSEQRILSFLETAGKKCMDMLKTFYYDKLSMEAFANTFGFGSVRSATVQKYKCLEKVRESVKEKSLTYEDFFE